MKRKKQAESGIYANKLLTSGALEPTRGAAAFTTTALRLELLARTAARAATRGAAALVADLLATDTLREAQRAIVQMLGPRDVQN